MKRIIPLIIILILSGCRTDVCEKLDNDFEQDLSSEDTRIAADLYLDVFNKDLDSLTYEYFINYLQNNEKPSAHGITEIIENADEHYFKTKKNAFLLVLYYKSCRRILCDNSSTFSLDTTHIYNKNEAVPKLSEFADKIKF